ncbi:MAG: AAA family ATPase [Candidatus Binataceae bacterium]
MSDPPWLWLIAGPNGTGKSTYAENNLAPNVREIVRPDLIAQELSPGAPDKVKLEAGRIALRRMRDLLAKRRTFAIETTLSGRLHLKILRLAKSRDWGVGVVFIGLRSPRLAIQRVKRRRLQGGHDVPPAEVRRRYGRSLANLPVAHEIADVVLVLDNSSATHPMKRVFESHRQDVIYRDRALPTWLRRAMGAKLRRPGSPG